MTYTPLRRRLAKLLPELSQEHLNLALPVAIGAGAGLGALAYNAVAPLDVDPIGLAVGSGLALGTQGRTPYNYAGLAALGLEGARYFNNAFTNTRDTETSPLLAMGIGAGTLGLREALRRGAVNYNDVGFPRRTAVDEMGKTSSPIQEFNRVASPLPKKPSGVEKPNPLPRVATDSTVAPINPATSQASVVVPSPTIDDYIAKSPLLNRDRARQYADPSSSNYQPDFVKMLSQDGLDDDFRAELAFPEDVLANQFKGSGVPSPIATGATHLPILNGSFDYSTQKGKLSSDVIVFRGSNLTGGEGKSNLVNQGVVPEGTYYPNAITSNPESLLRMAKGIAPVPNDDAGYFIKDKANGVYNQVLTSPSTSVAREQYINLTNSGRMATPMSQKNLSEPMLYVDELSGGSSPYNINDFYGLRAAKKRTTDKVTGNKYYRGVQD